jgi:hypothetical protein
MDRRSFLALFAGVLGASAGAARTGSALPFVAEPIHQDFRPDHGDGERLIDEEGVIENVWHRRRYRRYRAWRHRRYRARRYRQYRAWRYRRYRASRYRAWRYRRYRASRYRRYRASRYRRYRASRYRAWRRRYW